MEPKFDNNRIAEFRQTEKLSQRRLAKELGTSQANVSRWEQGIIVPSVVECWKIADFFGVSIDVICGRTEY